VILSSDKAPPTSIDGSEALLLVLNDRRSEGFVGIRIEKMIKNDFKLEVESLISKGLSFVTEEYVPARLAAQDWLD